MATSKADKIKVELDHIGSKIGDIFCSRLVSFGDAVLIFDEDGNQKLF